MYGTVPENGDASPEDEEEAERAFDGVATMEGGRSTVGALGWQKPVRGISEVV